MASVADGVNVATFVELLYATVVVSAEPPDGVTVAVSEDELIARLNDTVGATLIATPVALFAGVVEVTVGALLIVVNDELKALAMATPSAAVPFTLSVYVLLFTRLADGVIVATSVDVL